MTSNAVLLDKYQDYLAEKQFDILISLDGDEWGNSYRTDHAGNASFKRVFRNIQSLKEHYPKYFNKHITFNSVLHNRNETQAVRKFIFDNFGKYPSISELNNFGIIDTQKETFEEMYHKISSDISSLDEDFFNSSIEIMDLFRVVKYLSGNVFFTHNSLLKKTPYNIYPTGTCLPFGKNICHCEGEYISL